MSLVTDPATEGGEDIGPVTTNENGVAEFEVEDDDYDVVASHDDYPTNGIAGPVAVQGDDTSVEVTIGAVAVDPGDDRQPTRPDV